jgi:probable F420-dependent oxidoreductase
MELGVVTPVLTQLPSAHARWEQGAGIAEVERIVTTAERLGYRHVTCSEHVAIPEDVASVRGGTYWDPLATFGYLAARTTTIRFVTFVLVLGYHHPLAIVKRYGTLDRVCGGRLVLGVGVGSLEEEFDLLGAEFAGRGDRADDAIRALRASFGRERPEYHGSHYDYAGWVVEPAGEPRVVPIWIGGQSARSLRRAVELADGWAPFGLRLDAIARMLERARATAAWAARVEPLDVVLQTGRPLDPAGDPDATRAAIDAVRAAGATSLNVRLVHHSPEHCCEQLAALRELVPATPAP